MTNKSAKQPTEPAETERVDVLVVTAPGGPRRRAGISFGETPVELLKADLGEDPEKTINLLRADPLLKIDAKTRTVPVDQPNQE